MKINLGDFRHRIAIQYNAQPDRTNDNGTLWPDWQPLVTAMAKKELLSMSRIGRWFYQGSSEQSETDMVYTIRYREDIKAGMQLIDGLETFEIKVTPVDPDGHRRWLIVMARMVLQNGG